MLLSHPTRVTQLALAPRGTRAAIAQNTAAAAAAAALWRRRSAHPRQSRRCAGVVVCSASNSTNSTDSSSSSSTGSQPTGGDPISMMNEMSQFMSQFSESDVLAAFTRAASTINDLQQQHDQQLPLADTQQQQEQQQHDKQQQQQQQQQPQVPATALAFLQTVLQRAQERSASQDSSGVGDPIQYLKSQAGQGLLWEVLKEQFTPDETSLLDTAFGPSWQAFGQKQQLDMSQLWALSALEGEDLSKLGVLMDKLNAMSRQMDGLAARLPTKPQTPTTSSSASGSSSSSSSPARPDQSSKRSWGSGFLRRSTPNAAAASSSSSSGRPSRVQAYRWDVPLLSAEPTQRVQRLLALSDRMLQQQQQQWGVPASQQFQMLLRLYHQLVQLEASQLLHMQQQQQQQQQWAGVPPLSPEAAASVYATVSSELGWLVQQVSESDTATGTAFWYLNALLDDSWWQSSGSSGSSSGSDGGWSQQQQQQLARLEALGVFLAAAANLEPLRAWASACAETRPEAAGIPELQEVLAALDNDWFIKPSQRQKASQGAQAAAAAAAVAAAAAAEPPAAVIPRSSSSSSSSSGSGLPGAPGPAFGLRPEMIDADRIQQMACLDGTLLWFLAEMEAAPEPREVVLKWKLHPEIGPHLKGRSWLQKLDLQQPLLGVYNRIRTLSYMAQVS